MSGLDHGHERMRAVAFQHDARTDAGLAAGMVEHLARQEAAPQQQERHVLQAFRSEARGPFRAEWSGGR